MCTGFGLQLFEVEHMPTFFPSFRSRLVREVLCFVRTCLLYVCCENCFLNSSLLLRRSGCTFSIRSLSRLQSSWAREWLCRRCILTRLHGGSRVCFWQCVCCGCRRGLVKRSSITCSPRPSSSSFFRPHAAVAFPRALLFYTIYERSYVHTEEKNRRKQS